MDRMNASNDVRRLRLTTLAGVALALLLVPARVGAALELKEYQTPYYIIYTDHDMDMVREAAARITAMAEEYHNRTKDFSGTIRKRLAFYLYSRLSDYAASGGAGAGMFAGNRLMAFVPKGGGAEAWRVVQHEGFHQFVTQVIGGRMPIWVNEGLAEYFGEGIWTGDDFVTGVIPNRRLGRVRALIQDNQLRPFPQMFTLSSASWRSNLDVKNYDQAWSMVHFLVNADDGKYRKPFAEFLKDVSSGRTASVAFAERFGSDLKAFEDKYRQWWLSVPDDSAAESRTVAVCQTLESFLARAYVSSQRFQGAQEFFEAARADKLQCPKEQWLPPSLLKSALAAAPAPDLWSLVTTGPRPKLVLTRQDGATFTAEFTQDPNKEFKVKVEIRRPPTKKPP